MAIDAIRFNSENIYTPQANPVASESINNQTEQTAQPAAESKSNSDSSDTGTQASSAVLSDTVKKINSSSSSVEAKFDVHEDTKRIMIKMVDKNTKEVIKEFPEEKALDLIAKAWEMAGMLVDEKR